MKLSSLSARPVSATTNTLGRIMVVALSTPDGGAKEVEGPTGVKLSARVLVTIEGAAKEPLHPQAPW